MSNTLKHTKCWWSWAYDGDKGQNQLLCKHLFRCRVPGAWKNGWSLVCKRKSPLDRGDDHHQFASSSYLWWCPAAGIRSLTKKTNIVVDQIQMSCPITTNGDRRTDMHYEIGQKFRHRNKWFFELWKLKSIILWKKPLIRWKKNIRLLALI